MDALTISSVVIVCYCVCEGLKRIPVASRFLPICSIGLGLVLSILGYFVVPNFPADSVYMAIIMGVVSGASASGIYDAIDYAKKPNYPDNNNDNDA